MTLFKFNYQRINRTLRKNSTLGDKNMWNLFFSFKIEKKNLNKVPFKFL